MNISFTPSISLTHKSQNDHQERQWNKHHFPNDHLFDSNGGYSIDSITPCQHVNVEGLHLRIQKLVICHSSSRKNNQLTMRSQVFSPSPKYPKTLPPAKLVCHFEIPKHHPFLIKNSFANSPFQLSPGVQWRADRVRICSILVATSMPPCETMSFGQPGWSQWSLGDVGKHYSGRDGDNAAFPDVSLRFFFYPLLQGSAKLEPPKKEVTVNFFPTFVMDFRVGVFLGS